MIITTLAQLAGGTHTAALHLVRDLAVLAVAPSPAPTPAATVHTDEIVQFMATKIAPILLGLLGVVFLSQAHKGQISKVLTSSAIAIVGLAFIAGAGALFLFGESLIHLIFG